MLLHKSSITCLIALTFSAVLLAPAVHAQEQRPYFHCSANVGTNKWSTPAVWAHIQSDNFRTAYEDCMSINRVAGGYPPCTGALDPSTGLFADCYAAVMLGYSIDELIRREKAAVEIPACWGTNKWDGSVLVITVLGAPVEYAERWCQGLQPVLQPPTPVEQGITITSDSTGQQTYLAPGTFVKIGDAPAIYVVAGGQLHAFSTWQQFLNAGGMADLSNVVRYSYLRDNGGLFGAPVQ